MKCPYCGNELLRGGIPIFGNRVPKMIWKPYENFEKINKRYIKIVDTFAFMQFSATAYYCNNCQFVIVPIQTNKQISNYENGEGKIQDKPEQEKSFYAQYMDDEPNSIVQDGQSEQILSDEEQSMVGEESRYDANYGFEKDNKNELNEYYDDESVNLKDKYKYVKFRMEDLPEELMSEELPED